MAGSDFFYESSWVHVSANAQWKYAKAHSLPKILKSRPCSLELERAMLSNFWGTLATIFWCSCVMQNRITELRNDCELLMCWCWRQVMAVFPRIGLPCITGMWRVVAKLAKHHWHFVKSNARVTYGVMQLIGVTNVTSCGVDTHVICTARVHGVTLYNRTPTVHTIESAETTAKVNLIHFPSTSSNAIRCKAREITCICVSLRCIKRQNSVKRL